MIGDLKITGEWRPLMRLLGVVLLAGCSTQEGPESVESYRHDYHADLAVAVAPDTVLLVVGTSGQLPGDLAATAVLINTAESADELLRLDLRVLGMTYDPYERATIDSRWRGDTLQVWCGHGPPRYWGPIVDYEKTSFVSPWFMPAQVGVTLPAGVHVRYLGRWFE